MENINLVIAEKIKTLRKANNLTQNELAEKINYSNKAVSRWETGEVTPDIATLNNLCEVFGVTLASMFEEDIKPKTAPSKQRRKIVSTKVAITLLAIAGVWLIATICYNVLRYAYHLGNVWQIFIFAIPLSCVVGIIFNAIWGKPLTTFLLVTTLIWSALASIYLVFVKDNIWYIYFIGIPLQIGVLLWASISKNMHDSKNVRKMLKMKALQEKRERQKEKLKEKREKKKLKESLKKGDIFQEDYSDDMDKNN